MIQSTCLVLFVTVFQRAFSHDLGPCIRQITDPVQHAEGPTWDGRTGVLYYVNLNMGQLYSYNPETASTAYIQFSGTVSPVVPVKGATDKFVIGLNKSIVLVTWDGKSDSYQQQVLTSVAPNFPNSRFNDGKVDSRGRLWFGTMANEVKDTVAPNEGSLYVISKLTFYARPVINPVSISNGLAWNKANTKFYYIDSATYKLAQYDYNEFLGTISNRRVLYDFKSQLGDGALPDGMTIDKDDKLWIGLFGAGSVVQIDPNNGRLMRRIPLPAQYVTSVMWGGANLDVLFVTTSKLKLNDAQIRNQPGAGSLYAITGLGTSGLPMFEADVL